MNVKVKKEEFEKALSKVSCALGAKNEDVITRNIGIEASGKTLRFVASSQKVCAEYIMEEGPDLEISSDGKIVVEGTALISNVSNLHSGVMINAEVGEEESDGDGYKRNLMLSYDTKHGEKWDHVHNLLDPGFFPTIDFSWNTKHSVTYSTAKFLDGVTKAVSAASDEVHRPSYNAVMVGFGDNGVEFFASDGRQMAYTRDASKVSSETRKALIQSQVISKVAKKNILDSSEDVDVSISPDEDGKNKGKVRFHQNGFTVITNFLEEADLLPYEHVLSLSSDICSFTLNAGLLKEDLKVFSDLENKDSKWTFSPDGIKIVSVGNFDRKSEGFVSGVEDYKGGSCEMRLSLRYWESLLSKCDKSINLKVEITNERVPISIEVSPDPSLYRFFIMPITDANN